MVNGDVLSDAGKRSAILEAAKGRIKKFVLQWLVDNKAEFYAYPEDSDGAACMAQELFPCVSGDGGGGRQWWRRLAGRGGGVAGAPSVM
jgi:hypothetical protein